MVWESDSTPTYETLCYIASLPLTGQVSSLGDTTTGFFPSQRSVDALVDYVRKQLSNPVEVVEQHYEVTQKVSITPPPSSPPPPTCHPPLPLFLFSLCLLPPFSLHPLCMLLSMTSLSIFPLCWSGSQESGGRVLQNQLNHGVHNFCRGKCFVVCWYLDALYLLPPSLPSLPPSLPPFPPFPGCTQSPR